ncbi:MAG: hypothetical protein HQM13_07330 [SAR324 cluster bacterium]|nr:hypothetical protein [SAR324 cluster bacterium]
MKTYFNSRWNWMTLLGVILLGVCFTSKPGNLKAADDSFFWISATGDLRGEIKPCGCSTDGDMGGLLRRATYLKQMRSSHESVVYLDLGNNFPVPSEQGRLKVDLIQKAMLELRPDAILVGPNELLYERPLLNQNLPYFLSNLRGDWLVKKSLFVAAGEKRVGLWGYLSPAQIYQNKHEELDVFPVSSQFIEDLQKQLEETHPDFAVLMFRGDEKELQKFEKSQLFDLIITGSNNDDELNQILEMKTSEGSFISIPTKGQGAFHGRVDLNNKKKVNLELDWFLAKYEDDQKMMAYFDVYDQSVQALFFSNLDRMEKHELEAPYAGEETCKTCHIVQHQIWSTSRHSNAFATLENVNKHFDLECLQCHVVGLQKEGFLSPELTPKLLNVQCENCHGPGKAHSSNPKIRTPNAAVKEVCSSCHQGSHSPKFDYSLYYPKIAH